MVVNNKKKSKHRGLWRWVVALVLITIVFLVEINREWIEDYWRGITFEPSDGIAAIRDKLGLADYGMFLFNASNPVLSDSEEFNDKCRFEKDEEEAILGCYLDKDIYIYNIVDEKLDGIRECTAAHELLHAVWKRMGEEERKAYVDSLSLVYEQNKDYLEEELGVYDNNERSEELYVRAGTEVKKLPADLERHFAKVFKDQDKVVGYYDKYIAVFRDLQAELDALEAEMNEIKLEINTREGEYSNRLARLNAEIDEFNSCAETAGCFSSQWAFDQRRSVLIGEQRALTSLYERIEELINTYNQKVDKYNEDVLSNNKLNQIINSASTVEELSK